MDSQIAKALRLSCELVAVLFSHEKPNGALQGKEGCWSCIIPMLIAATRGKTAVFERKTTGCYGGTVGLGFGNAYENFPGGIEYFLSTGRGEGYREGEGYKKTPELAKDFVACLPITDISYKYVVFKPLSQVDITQEVPQLVIFYANVDQLSALTVLANYSNPGNENVIIPFGSGCQSICLIPYYEAQKERPRAVVGLTDITVRPMIEPNKLSFTVPYHMFLEMEGNVQGSFLEKPLWHKIRTRT